MTVGLSSPVVSRHGLRGADKQQWRYVIIRYFVVDKVYKTGWWSKDEAKVLKRATRKMNFLDSQNPHHEPEGVDSYYLEDR